MATLRQMRGPMLGTQGTCRCKLPTACQLSWRKVAPAGSRVRVRAVTPTDEHNTVSSPHKPQQEPPASRAPAPSSGSAAHPLHGLLTCLRLLGGPSAACAIAWLTLNAPPALAASLDLHHGYNEMMTLSQAEDALFSDSRLSFSAVMVMALLLYWLVKAVDYLQSNKPDGPPTGNDLFNSINRGKDQQQQQQHKQDPHDHKAHRMHEGEDRQADDPFGDHGIANAPVRTYFDGKPHPELGQDASALRAASLAKSAAYRVASMTRESQPRIHATLAALLSSGHKAGALDPQQRPAAADVDPVVDMCWRRALDVQRQKGGVDVALSPPELAALEKQLLEEVAEQCAAEQVAQLTRLVKEGKLTEGQQPAAGRQQGNGRR